MLEQLRNRRRPHYGTDLCIHQAWAEPRHVDDLSDDGRFVFLTTLFNK